VQVHVDQVERVFAFFLVGLGPIAARQKLLDRLARFFDESHGPSPVRRGCADFVGAKA
jgi:hypothetical protein